MSIKKQFLKTRPVCKVTFRLGPKDVKDAKEVCIAGDFNNWDTRKTPMDRLKNGTFKKILDFETGREFQFRYVVDQTTWINDPEADKYLPSGHGDENCVIVL